MIFFYPIFPYNLVGGSFFDLVEYYYFVKKDIPSKFIIAYYNDKLKTKIIKTLTYKYDIDIKDITFIKVDFYLRQNLNIVKNLLTNNKVISALTDFYDFLEMFNFKIINRNIYLFANGDRKNIDIIFKYYKYPVNVLVREELFDVYEKTNVNLIDYQVKINFDIFKKKEKYFQKNNNALINSFLRFKKYKPEIIEEFKSQFDKIFVISREYKKDDNITYIKAPINNLMKLFGTYIYITPERQFDVSPRLIIESKFFNKDIIYKNENNVKDGSWFRYYEDLNLHSLKQNDKILEILKGE